MNDFRIEFFIEYDEEQNIKLNSLDEREMEEWKRDMESRALSEFYNKKIKISSKKFDLGKRFCYNYCKNK